MNIRNFTYEGFDTAPVVAFSARELAPKPAEEVVEEPKSLPIFTAEDMEIAKTIARAEGVNEGMAAARSEFTAAEAAREAEEQVKVSELVEKMNAKLGELHAASQVSKHDFGERLGKLALAITKKVTGDVADKIIEAQIASIINESIGKVGGDEKIKIYVSGKNAGHINDKFTGVTVNVDEAMQQGDFKVEWNNGFAQRDVKKIWKSIEEICSRHSSLEDYETETETNLTLNNGE